MTAEEKFYKFGIVKARKDHKCGWCPEPIKKGDEYHYIRLLLEGELCQTRHHPECWEVEQEYMNKLIADMPREDLIRQVEEEGGIEGAPYQSHKRGSLESN